MASIKEIQGKLDTLRTQQRANQTKITKLRDDLDVAADGGNTGEIKAIQAEIAACEGIADSFTRRIGKTQFELSASGRARLKVENLKSVEIVKAEMEAAAKVAIEIDKTLAQLVAQLETLHKHGDAARKEATDLVRQLPARGRDRMYLLLQAVSFQDSMLGAVLEGELSRLDVFRKLAPQPDLRLASHRLGTFTDCLARHAEKLPAAFAAVAQQVNEGL